MDKYFTANAEFSKFSRNYMELKKGLPIRPSEMGVLNIITGTPGPHTSILLAELLGVSKPMITAHLASLLEKGYITKEQSREDRRVFYILPTSKAQALAERFREDINRQMEQMVKHMGESRFFLLTELIEDANKILEANRDLEE